MIGNSNEPGITSTVRSAPSITSADFSPGTPLLIASADLESGDANVNEVYGVQSSTEAQRLFGQGSRLATGVIEALNQGAQPVLAVAPDEVTETQDLLNLDSTSGTFNNPAKESPSSMTFTVDSTEKSVTLSLNDVQNETPESGKVLVNPTSDNFELDEAASSSGEVEYTHVDYSTALDAVEEYTGNVDFIAAWKERSDVTTDVLGTVQQRQAERQFGLAIAGVPQPIDADEFTQEHDTSRLQLFAGVRLQNFNTAIPSLLGLRARLGISSTPIDQQVPLPARPAQGLDATERATLIGKYVTPLERIGESVRIADDLTTVSDDNAEEQNFKYGFSRLVVDYLMENVHNMESPFVGSFNSPGALGQLRDLLNEEARPLDSSNVIYEYDADVELVTPTRVLVTFKADVAEPIRFIENEFVIGQNLDLQNPE